MLGAGAAQRPSSPAATSRRCRRTPPSATRYLEASMQNAEVVQSLGMADALIARWRELNAERHRAAAADRARKSVAMAALTRTARQAVQVLMLALGAWLVITGEATPGVMIATTILLGRALAPVEQVVGSWRVLAEGRARLPPPARAARRGRRRAAAHGAAGADRPAAGAAASCSARRRASACSSPASRCSSRPASRWPSSAPAAPASRRWCAC